VRELSARLLAALALVALGLSLPACGDASEAVAPAPGSETVTVTVTEPAPPPPPPQPSVPTDDDSSPAETETTGYEGDFPAPRSTKHMAKAFELGAASAERPLRDLEAFEDLVRTCDVATRSP
jgi:hypothetical protein